MNRWTTLLLAGGAVVVAVVLFVVLRPDDDEEAEPTPAAQTATAETTTEEATTGETTTEEATTEEATTEETTTDEEDDVQRILVEVRNGQPVGGVQRPEVELGSRVRLVVRSDVADHVHLHGYDLLADVAPGRQARITFTADLAGRFELELEDRGELVAELEVR